MSQEAFRSELHRMIQINGLLFVNESKLVDVMAADVDSGADFLNIFRGADNRDLLLVTSLRTLAVRSGMFSTKVRIDVSHHDLLGVQAGQQLMNRRVINLVQLQTERGVSEFWFGIHDPYDFQAIEITQHNANVAAQQIEGAMSVASSGSSEPQLDGISFASDGPEVAGEAARRAYAKTYFLEAFNLYVKAVDRLHDFYVLEQFRNREPGPRDAWLVEGMVNALGAAKAMDADADITAGVREATHRLRTITSSVERAGGNAALYRHGLELLAVEAPEVNIADIFWN